MTWAQYSLYFKLGIRHIVDLYSVEYILFLVAITAIFLLKDWRRVLILLGCFVFGYAITFYSAVLNLYRPNIDLVLYLVRLTVFLTALSNILRKKDHFHIRGNIQRNYFLAAIFGLIHGFGFAYYLGDMLGPDVPRLTTAIVFNLGLVLGQFVVLAIFLFLAFLFVNLMGINRRDWVLVISSGIAGVALTMMFEYRYW
jgi:hypothetical protein